MLERAPRGEPDEPPRRRLQVARWGLVPSWAKDASIGNRMINARMETVAEKPAFKRAFAKRRALLPADGYFEWYGEVKGKKQPFFIRPADGGVLAMAGLYELWRDPSVPDGRRRRPVAVDVHRPHDHGHRRPRPHPRPDAAAGREASGTPSGSTLRSTTPTSCAACWCRPHRAG